MSLVCCTLSFRLFDETEANAAAVFVFVVMEAMAAIIVLSSPDSRTHSLSCSSLFHYNIIRYESTVVKEGNVVVPMETKMQFRTERTVPKVSSG